MTGALLLLLTVIAQDPPAPAPPSAPSTPAPDAPAAPAVRAVDEAPPKVETRIEPREVRVGEQLTFELLVTHDGTRSFRMPDALDFGKAELIERQPVDTSVPDDAGNVIDRHAFKLAIFEPGRHVIGDFDLPYVDLQGREFTVPAKGGVVACKSVLANETAPELRPPPGPVKLIVEDRRPLYAGGALGIALLAGLIAFGFGRYMRGRAPLPPPPPPVPAEVIALGRLQSLRARNLPRQGLVKEFYLELSHILREYFGNRFDMNALEMTTPELLAELTDARLRGVRRSVVERFLGESDLVKFAKHLPNDEEVADVFLAAEDMVHRTTPRPAPAATPSGQSGAGPQAGAGSQVDAA